VAVVSDGGQNDSSSEEMTLQELRHRDGSAAAELNRIRNSPSFRLGVLFIQAIESPLRIFRLPWDLIVLAIEVVRESRNKPREQREKKLSRTILFISGESIDFHRQERIVSLMDEVQLDDSSIEQVVLTIGESGSIKPNHSVQEFSLPSSRRDSSIWGGLFSEQVELLLSVHRPAVIVFDGNYPHRGLTRVLLDRPRHKAIWIQPEVSSIKENLRKFGGAFDEIITIKDFIPSPENELNLDLRESKPIFWSAKSIFPKRAAKEEMDIPLDVISVLFHPPHEPSVKQKAILHDMLVMLRNEGAIVSIKTSEASKRWLRSYPHSLIRPIPNPYDGSTVKGFDFGISDGTQPSMSQMVEAGIPFISVPRLGVKGDTPFHRSKSVERLGCALVVTDSNETSPEWVIRRMLNPIKRRRMRSSCKRASIGVGTIEYAEWLVDQIEI